MNRHRPPAELRKFLRPYDPAIQDLALQVRSFVLDEMAPCHETIYDAYSAVALGYGWSDRFREGVFHVAVYANHVNLGFNFGASLPDPKAIFEGNGKQIRHLTIKSEDDLARPEIRSYVRRAIKVAREDARRLGGPLPPDSRQADKVISIVKAESSRKRRPKAKSGS